MFIIIEKAKIEEEKINKKKKYASNKKQVRNNKI